MTKDEWKQVETALGNFYDIVYLKADGYEVGLTLNRVSTYKNAIMIYVGGVFRGEWLTKDCEERRRFCWRRERSLLDRKQQANFKKLSKKEHSVDLDLALMGVISPSTLGIDMAKKDNADAQREKEKTTLYSRAKRVAVLEKALPKLAQVVLMAQDIIGKTPAGTYAASVSWGEYANPSFESVVGTVSAARQAGVMSVEQTVEELYGESMTEEDKAQEVSRLKAEQGVVQKSEPSAGDTGGLNDGES